MPRVSEEYLEARRLGIVRAAARCFARHGVHATSMRDLFRAANLSPGAVYRYFPSKDALVAAVAEWLAELPAADEPEAGVARPGDELSLELQLRAAAGPELAAALGRRQRRALERAGARWQVDGDDPRARLALAIGLGLALQGRLEPEADLEPARALARAWLAGPAPPEPTSGPRS